MKNNQIEARQYSVPENVSTFTILPENLLQHELVIQFKANYDEFWQAMVLPYLGFLLHNNHMTEAVGLIGFVQDMAHFFAGKQLIALFLSMAHWSEKLATNLSNIALSAARCLQDGRDLVLAQLLTDTVAVKSWINLTYVSSSMAIQILRADLTNADKCLLLKSPIVAQYSATHCVKENRYTVSVPALIVLKREGKIVTLSSKYFQAVENLITKKVCFYTILKLANENKDYIEELLAIIFYFSVNQQQRLFTKLEQAPHFAQATLRFFRVHLQATSFEVEPFIEFIENAKTVESISYSIKLCAYLLKNTTTVVKMANTVRAINKKMRDLKDQLAMLKMSKEKIPQRNEKMQLLMKQIKKLSVHWAVIPIHNKDTIGRCIDNFLKNDLQLLRYLIDITTGLIANKRNPHLIPYLFRLAYSDRSRAIKLCQLLMLEKEKDMPLIFEKLLMVFTKNIGLFDNLVTLATQVATAYHGMLRLSAFYLNESSVNIEEMEKILEWMNDNPHAALQLSLFLTISPKETNFTLFTKVILLCKKELTKFLQASQQFPLPLELHCRYLLEKHHQNIFDLYYTAAIENANKSNTLVPYHQIINYNLRLIYDNPHLKISLHAQQILYQLIQSNEIVLVKNILNLYQQDSDLAEHLLIFGHEASSIHLVQSLLYYINHPSRSPLDPDQLKTLIASHNRETLAKIVHVKQFSSKYIKHFIVNGIRNNTAASTTTLSEEQWSHLQTEFQQYTKLHAATTLDPHVVKHAQANYLALVIANLLISQEGNLNTHLIPEIKKRLLTDNITNTAYSVHLQGVLHEITIDSDLQNQLHALQAPAKVPSLSAELIRHTLNLKHNAEITHVDYKRAILTSLLVHLRQEKSVGSCVGTSIMISYKTQLRRVTESIALALSDNQFILENNSSLRLSVRFFNKLNSSELNSDVHFDQNGEIDSLVQTDLYLWQSPWLIRLAHYLNILQNDIPSWVLTTIQNHKNQFKIASLYPISYYTSKRTLIKLLVKEAKFDESFVTQAQNIVLAETQNPIVRVMESIVLGGDYQKQVILQYYMAQPVKDLVSLRISLTLSGALGPNGGMASSLWQSQLIRCVANLYDINSGQGTVDMVMRTLNMLRENADVQHIPLRSITLRGLLNAIHDEMKNFICEATPTKEMVYRAFLLYAPMLNDFLLDIIQLEFCNTITENQLHEFNPYIITIFPNRNYDITLVKLVSTFLLYVEKMGNKKALSLLKSLNNQIKQKIIHAFNHDDGSEQENSVHGRMVLIDTDNIDELNPNFICTQEAFAQLYNRIVLSACEATLERQNPLDSKLTETLLEFINSQFWIESLTKNFEKRGAGKPWKMSSGGNHTLAWSYSVQAKKNDKLKMYGFHPSNAAEVLAHYIQFGSTNGTRFKPFNYLGASVPGHAVSAMLGHTSLHPIWRAPDRNEWVKVNMKDKSEKLSRIILGDDQIQQLIPLCAEKFQQEFEKSEFLEESKAIKPNLSLFEFRRKILDIAIVIRGSVKHISDIEWQIDTQLLTILTPDQRTELTVLHIADTNWLNTQDHQDIHFCLLVSPLSLEVELWRCNQDGTKLQKELQNKWLCDQRWEIYYVT